MFLLSAILSLSMTASAQVAPEALAMKNAITSNCQNCHIGRAYKVNSFGDFSNAATLKKYVDLKNPRDSVIFKKIASGDMPDTSQGDFISNEERQKLLSVVETWIKAGAPDFEAKAKRVVDDNDTVIKNILSDLSNQRDQEEVRYISFHHLLTSPTKSSLISTYQEALSKLLNSLSWNSSIVKPTLVDANNLIYRINLSDYAWDREKWQALERAYNYKGEYLRQFDDFGQLRQQTKSSVPVLRGDWLIAKASQPPLYHTLAEIPFTRFELERRLRVDTSRNIESSRIVRGGFINSGVSQNNRIIERHDSQFGAYWISYDFASSLGRKNIILNPQGPISDGTFAAFEPDGGEVIFNLPNGMQAYMLVNAAGTRIDKGPIQIVSDPSRPDRSVVNGLSCMGCHANGMIVKNDDIAKGIDQSRFSRENLQKILKIYDDSALQRQMQRDAARFANATAQAGITKSSPEVISSAVLNYESTLSKEEVQNELGLNNTDLGNLANLDSNHSALQLINSSNSGMKREVIEALYQKRAEEISDTFRGRRQNRQGQQNQNRIN